MGGALLLRAADRCIRVAQDVGGVALLIDAKSDRAASWYESYGALRLEDTPLSLVLPLAVAADALERGKIRRFRRDSKSLNCERMDNLSRWPVVLFS